MKEAGFYNEVDSDESDDHNSEHDSDYDESDIGHK